jgi:hypothetical protein
MTRPGFRGGYIRYIRDIRDTELQWAVMPFKRS